MTHAIHDHGPNVTEAQFCRECVHQRLEPLLKLHAGHHPWGTNDGSLRGVLQAWGLPPEEFLESLTGWGYTVTVA